MNSSFTRSLFTLLPILALGLTIASEAEARTINVNCAMKSLQTALDRANPGDTLNVSGTCVERITVRTDRVTIDGGGAAIIEGVGVAGTGSLVRVQALNVRIRNITIQNSPGHGIHVRRGGSARIEGTTVTNSVRNGILVNESSSARIGPGSGSHPVAGTPPGNDINLNGRHGINVRSGGFADIFHNLITGNERGISITNAGSADIDGNEITGNTARGISLLTNGSVSLGQDSAHGETNLIQENVIGIRCRLGGSASGILQDFGTGNPGSADHTNDTDFSGSCPVEGAIFTP